MISKINNLEEIEGMSWEAFRELAAKELSTIPPNYRIVFEAVFRTGIKWIEFEQFILSLAGKSYDQILPVSKEMAVLGDLSEDEVGELVDIAILNKTQYKSPKIEYYLICRSLHTRDKVLLREEAA